MQTQKYVTGEEVPKKRILLGINHCITNTKGWVFVKAKWPWPIDL